MTVVTLTDTLAAILSEVEKLSPREQHLLLLKLKKDELLEKSRKLKKGIKPNTLTTTQVAQRVRKNRAKWKKTS
jgi:hypothetical protein